MVGILCPPPQVEGEGLGLCVKKFCVNNGYLYNIHRSLYQTARNMYWGSFFHLSCPPGQGALFTYLVKYESGVGSKRSRGSWPLQILQVCKKENRSKNRKSSASGLPIFLDLPSPLECKYFCHVVSHTT